MGSNKRQLQKIWFSTIDSEKVSEIDTIPMYSTPEMHKMTVSDTSGTSEEISAGLVPNYDRYITQWKNRWDPFELKEGMVCWIDVQPELKTNGELATASDGSLITPPDYRIVKKIGTQKSCVIRYGILKIAGYDNE